jgi:replicative DNA helicase
MNARAEFNDPEGAPVAQLRIPPHSIEAESSVLGALLLDGGGSAWDRVSDLLTDTDFYRYEHRLAFQAIAELVNACKPADVVTVHERLQGIKGGHEVTLAYLGELAQYVPSASNIRRYAEIVRERSILRKLVAASDEIATDAFNPQGRPVSVIADDAEARIFNIIESRGEAVDEWASMDEMVVRELDLIQERHDGSDMDLEGGDFIPTGLEDLDDMLDGGMRAGQLIVIGARPGMGKSAIADTIGLHVARDQGLPVGKFSMEMQNQEGGQRALASTAKVPLHAIRQPKRLSDYDWSNLTSGVELLRKIPFYSNEKSGLNINQLRSKARVLARRRGLRLLVVDYLQLMTGTDPRQPRTYQLEEASRGLKSLAKELKVPVIALVQVSRGVEKELDQMPRMSDIKDCGSIEQDADVIVFLHRPIVVKPDLSDEWKYYAEASLAKQRGGRTGRFNLTYIGAQTRFTNWPKDTPKPQNLVVEKKPTKPRDNM